MRLTKMGHACVRLDKEDGTLVIDPGGFTEPLSFDDVHAVLITHEHPDHLDGDRLRHAIERNPLLEVWANTAVGDALGGLDGHLHTVGDGDAFPAAGFEIGVLGQKHAVIHPDIPVIENTGFFIDNEVFHPGDAFTVPDVPVGTLLAPTNAPWMKVSELIDYLREVRPARAYSVHDGLLNENGLGLVDGVLSARGQELNNDCRRLVPGETVELPT